MFSVSRYSVAWCVGNKRYHLYASKLEPCVSAALLLIGNANDIEVRHVDTGKAFDFETITVAEVKEFDNA